MPIHFHTHDIGGGQIGRRPEGRRGRAWTSSTAPWRSHVGLTSQPSLNALVEALRFTDARHRARLRRPAGDRPTTGKRCASIYAPFETGHASPARPRSTCTRCPAGSTRTSTSRPSRWASATAGTRSAATYAEVNQLFGDIVKVTPSSKVVGDMALFMVANNLTPEDVLDPKRELAFPEIGGRVLRGPARPAAGRVSRRAAGSASSAADKPLDRAARCQPAAGRSCEAARENWNAKLGRPRRPTRTSSRYLLYPRVFPDFVAHQAKYSDTSACCRRPSSSTAWSRARRSASRSSRARR